MGKESRLCPGRVYRRERYTLVPRPVLYGDGRAYDVFTPSGVPVGWVETYMATMERRSPGARYVYKRWTSKRWSVSPPGGRTLYLAYETPGRAAERLLHYHSEHGMPDGEVNGG